LTAGERSKAYKEITDKLEKRHADKRDARRRRRGFIEGDGASEFPSVVPMGTAIDTTGPKIEEGYP